MKHLSILILKESEESACISCVPLQSLYAQGFGGRPWSERSMSQVLPQCGMAAITVVGARAGDWGDKARARCEPEVLLHSATNTASPEGGTGPQVPEQKPRGSRLTWFHSSKYVMCPSQNQHLHPIKEKH